ncbi:MAG: hypothetical protein EP326_07970, partial [Deltaproteobacteria bacterium]
MKKSFLRSDKAILIIPSLALFIALIQWGIFLTTDLTEWKGGGFGMYTTLHPNTARTIWLEYDFNGFRVLQRPDELQKRIVEEKSFGERSSDVAAWFKNEMQKMRYFPYRSRLESFAKDFKAIANQSGQKISNICIKVGELKLNPKTDEY